MRIEGYQTRLRNKRLFTASFVTAPVINSGMRAPKRGVTVKSLLPEDCMTPIDKGKKERLMELAEKTERRRTEDVT